ncbi:MAG TPA: hypothetical protein VF898_03530, partial [Chloroflexota bacterium]
SSAKRSPTPTATARTGASGPLWGLPFATGVSVTLGPKGLHDCNFRSARDSNTGTVVYTFAGAGTDCTPSGGGGVQDASLDFIPTDTSPVPVLPLASGTVLVAWSLCHLVVVDHGPNAQGSHTWVEYLHLNVRVHPGDRVGRGSILGYTTNRITAGDPCGEQSEGANGQPVPHVHLAFLTGTGTSGAYMRLEGTVLCGLQVIMSATIPGAANGALKDVAHTQHVEAPGDTFSVPSCPTGPGPRLVTQEKAIPTPASRAYDLVRGQGDTLWFTEFEASKIGRVTPSGTITEYGTPTANAQPDKLTTGSDGDVWFVEDGVPAVVRVSPDGSMRETRLPTPPNMSASLFLAAAADGGIWFADFSNAYAGHVSPNGSMREFPLAGASAPPIVAHDGSLWFGEVTAGRIGRITPDGTVTEYHLRDGYAPTARAPVVATDGSVWFGEYGTAADGTPAAGVVRITPGGQLAEYDAPNPVAAEGADNQAGPSDFTLGPDGRVWFTITDLGGNGKVGAVTPQGAVSEYPASGTLNVFGLDAGPDGGIWLAESNANRIGRIAPDGSITAYVTCASPDYLTFGADGTLWYTCAEGIGRIIPSSGAVDLFPTRTPKADSRSLVVAAGGLPWFIELGANAIGWLAPQS